MDLLVEGILSNNMTERNKTIEKIILKQPIELKSDLLQIALEGPTYAKLGALKSYGNIISKDEIGTILEFTKNKDWHMRLEALKCIANLMGEDSLEILKPFLEDKAYGVRSEVELIISNFKK
ncbi:HEAT repeat domain-containing protein [Brevibacillus laterosporus]|uniref:HEAT repeat domain-containing protein n=1 Tax=Brevibacillus laterosporus TaxID=1465 RepID=UPI0018CDA26E|nr:HEAT repeat domain-containing protein [Brevibacillus laterosporus]MBG9786967.1 hypothetical protein [Brevibacillus laterosporus]